MNVVWLTATKRTVTRNETMPEKHSGREILPHWLISFENEVKRMWRHRIGQSVLIYTWRARNFNRTSVFNQPHAVLFIFLHTPEVCACVVEKNHHNLWWFLTCFPISSLIQCVCNIFVASNCFAYLISGNNLLACYMSCVLCRRAAETHFGNRGRQKTRPNAEMPRAAD